MYDYEDYDKPSFSDRLLTPGVFIAAVITTMIGLVFLIFIWNHRPMILL